jgi:hypothetical protein
MLIALLAVLGVDLIVVVVLLVSVLGRRRWVSRQPGAFKGIAHVIDGQVPHLSSKARRGYGRWVRDILVWTPAPFYLRNALAAVDTVQGTHNPAGKIRRLGDNPRVITLTAGGAHIDITVRAEDVALMMGPFPGSRPISIHTAPPTESDTSDGGPTA